MIHRRLNISNLHWIVDVFIDNGSVDYAAIIDCLYSIGATSGAVFDAMEMFDDNKPNEAFTCSTQHRHTCMYIGRTTSGNEFINSMVHELRHLVDHIASYYGIDNGEAVGYISGDTAFLLAEDICRLGCDGRCTKHG